MVVDVVSMAMGPRAMGLHLKGHVSRDGNVPGQVAGKNEFYIEKGGEPEVKSSFCHVVSQLARGVSQSGPASWGYGSETAQC